MDTLVQYGFTDRIGGLFSFHFPRPPLCAPARVVRVDRGRVLVASEGGLLQLEGGDAFVTGDWIAVTGHGHDRAIQGALPRSSVLRRKRAFDPLSEAQVLGANIDLVGVVVPLDRALSTNRLERTLVAAWDSGAMPIVILTKADLSTRFDGVVAETMERVRDVEVFTTSAEGRDGLEHLRGRIGTGQTLALLGPSGAGKSSLVNALTGGHRQDTGQVRSGDGRGRHTTTARELVPLGDGALVMDTPGLRGFALWDAEEGLSDVFRDIEELFGACRFRDCAHDREPGCAVQAAVASGEIEERRWLSYRKMERELADLHRRKTLADQRHRGKPFHRPARDRMSTGGRPDRFLEE